MYFTQELTISLEFVRQRQHCEIMTLHLKSDSNKQKGVIVEAQIDCGFGNSKGFSADSLRNTIICHLLALGRHLINTFNNTHGASGYNESVNMYFLPSLLTYLLTYLKQLDCDEWKR